MNKKEQEYNEALKILRDILVSPCLITPVIVDCGFIENLVYVVEEGISGKSYLININFITREKTQNRRLFDLNRLFRSDNYQEIKAQADKHLNNIRVLKKMGFILKS